MNKRYSVQFPSTPKTDWCLGLMIKELLSGADIIDWNSLKKKDTTKRKYLIGLYTINSIKRNSFGSNVCTYKRKINGKFKFAQDKTHKLKNSHTNP